MTLKPSQFHGLPAPPRIAAPLQPADAMFDDVKEHLRMVYKKLKEMGAMPAGYSGLVTIHFHREEPIHFDPGGRLW